MLLPEKFLTTIQNTFGDEGSAFLATLPALINEASHRWKLSNIHPVSNLSYNFVAYADTEDLEVVLKIGVPNGELTSEMTALRLFDGRGSVRLYQADEKKGKLLLERLQPGEMLAELKDDEQATQLAAQVMLDLWLPAPEDRTLIQLRDWFKGFERLKVRFDGGTGTLDKNLVEQAETAVREFFAEEYPPKVIHGDLHHFNILSSARG